MNRVKRTPENLVRHELIGLSVTADNTDTDTGYTHHGIVINETRDTFRIETGEEEEKTLPKERHVFTFTLPDTNTDVSVDGSILTGRPAERLKKTFPRSYHG